MRRREFLNLSLTGLLCGLNGCGLNRTATIQSALAAEAENPELLDKELSTIANDEVFLNSLRMIGQSEWRRSRYEETTQAMFGNRKENRKISEVAIAMIVAQEVGSKKYFSKQRLDRLVFPGGESGPTIGMGYDIGQLQNNQKGLRDLHDDWDGFIEPEMIDQLARGRGLKSEKARKFVSENQQVSVSWDVADKQLREQMIPYLIGDILDKLPKDAENLPDKCIGALCSLAYNRGVSFNAIGPRYTEMRNIRFHIERGNLKKIPDEFLSMRRLWPKTNGLFKRREVEGSLFLAGLLEAGL